MTEPRKVLINGHLVRLAGDHMPDVEVASRVRMLMRDQIDHEAICVTARDRIMWLSQEVERLSEALKAIRQYGSDTLSGRSPDDGPDDRKWQRDAVREMTRRARAALPERRADG
jgi:hypothetical protein